MYDRPHQLRRDQRIRQFFFLNITNSIWWLSGLVRLKWMEPSSNLF